jgi:hypothetical protein
MMDIKEKLDELVPEPARISDWQAVLREARPRRRSLSVQLAVATGIAVLAALFVVVPWKGSERVGILDRALAAVGDGPVLHVVLRYEPGFTRVDLRSGKREPIYGEREFWYDQDRRLLHEIRRFGGIVEYEWVSRQNAPPSELAALTVASREYRSALEAGTARITGQGAIDGERVYWIRVPSPRGDGFAWQIAVSRKTYEPVLIRSSFEGRTGVAEHVLRLERMTAGDADLDEADVTSSPTKDPSGNAGNLVGSGTVRIPLEEAAKTLGRAPLWLGRDYAGLPLASYAYRLYVRGRDGKVQTSGVGLYYERPADAPQELVGRRSISIVESTDRAESDWPPPRLFRDGSVVVELNRAFEKLSPPVVMYRGSFMRDGLYVSIQAVGPSVKALGGEKLLIEAARQARRMPPAKAGRGRG